MFFFQHPLAQDFETPSSMYRDGYGNQRRHRQETPTHLYSWDYFWCARVHPHESLTLWWDWWCVYSLSLNRSKNRAGWPAHADVWPSINALPKETSGNWGINLNTECVHWKADDASWRDAGGTSTTTNMRFVVSTHLGKSPFCAAFPYSPAFVMQGEAPTAFNVLVYHWICHTNSIQCLVYHFFVRASRRICPTNWLASLCSKVLIMSSHCGTRESYESKGWTTDFCETLTHTTMLTISFRQGKELIPGCVVGVQEHMP